VQDSAKPDSQEDAKNEREARLQAALRENLRKRKQQTRKRASDGAKNQTDEGSPALDGGEG